MTCLSPCSKTMTSNVLKFSFILRKMNDCFHCSFYCLDYLCATSCDDNNVAVGIDNNLFYELECFSGISTVSFQVKIVIILCVFEITNQLLTHPSL